MKWQKIWRDIQMIWGYIALAIMAGAFFVYYLIHLRNEWYPRDMRQEVNYHLIIWTGAGLVVYLAYNI